MRGRSSLEAGCKAVDSQSRPDMAAVAVAAAAAAFGAVGVVVGGVANIEVIGNGVN